MADVILLPPGVSIAILAFLLSLLPAGLFIWLWYLRHYDRPVPPKAIAWGFLFGMGVVGPAYLLERMAPDLWTKLSPSTVHYFEGAILPLQTTGDVLLPAVATFLIVALVEEGLRYLGLWAWFRRSRVVDQIFDGMLIGIAAGLGFATLENTLYFFQLFQAGNFDTLVFVFFLRFLISTLAHVSFGGIMGALLAKAVFEMYAPWRIYLQAFLLPWFLHGLYDWLLEINQAMYAVLLLLPPLLTLIFWSERRDFLVINREGSRRLVVQRSPLKQLKDTSAVTEKSWNKYAPWLGQGWRGGGRHA